MRVNDPSAGPASWSAGPHEFVSRVDFAFGRSQPASDRRDGFTGYGDVGLEHIARGRDAPSPDHQIMDGLGHDDLRYAGVSGGGMAPVRLVIKP